MAKTRAWCFTINNWTNNDLCKILIADRYFKYCIIGDEIGEESTKHLQGYVYFINKVKFNFVKSIFERAHIEIAKGSPEENRAYCTKDKFLCEYGDLPKKGQRTDIALIKSEIIDNHKTVKELIDTVPLNYQTLKLAEALSKYQSMIPRENVEVIWLYGPSGSGKTKKSIELADGDYWMSSGSDLSFWNGYYGQKTVILDELRPEHVKYTDLFRILDRYPYQVNIKGSSVPLRATKIIVTSPLHPKDFICNEEQKKQLLRRIHKIENVCGPQVYGNTYVDQSVRPKKNINI